MTRKKVLLRERMTTWKSNTHLLQFTRDQESTLSNIDNGLGIDADDLEHIFDFTHRGQSSQGYGIRLYVSKLICDH